MVQETTTRLPDADRALLEHLYTFEHQNEVKALLEAHPFLLPIVLEAPTRIARYFPGARLLLEVRSDPEMPERVYLILSVESDLAEDQWAAASEQFNAAWGRAAWRKSQRKLVISV